VSKIKRHLEESMSWQDIANLTHATQVEKFNWCACEEQEQFPMRIALEWRGREMKYS
jgi:hypothetical protein